jgi:hypothetical protein
VVRFLGEGQFDDLGSLVDGGLSVQGWLELSNVVSASGFAPDGSPLFIDGTGLLTGQTGGQSAFLLSEPVPEPATCTLLFGGASIILARRRRHS